jgi:hypothetical protein
VSRVLHAILSAAVLAAVLQAPAITCADGAGIDAEQGLVGYWNFDEGAGTAVHDHSPSGADGHITGATWAKGIRGGALEFDGVDDFVSVRHPGSGATDKAITVEAWIQPTGSNVNANLVCAGPESLDFGMWIQGGRLVGGLWNSTGTQFSATSAGGPTPGRWCHVAMTCDLDAGKTVALYVNGIPSGTIAATGTAIRSGHTTIDIGGRTPNSWHFRGLIDEVKVYNRVLGAEELRRPYDDYLKRRAAEIDITAYKNSPRIWTGNPEDRTVSFRGSFTFPEPTRKRVLMVCDGDHYQVFLNGKVLVPGKDFAEAQVVDITSDLVRGENVVAAQATDKGGRGGFFVHIGSPSKESPGGYQLLASGKGMKCSPHPAKGWQSREFDDSTWTPAHPVAGFDSLVALKRNFPDVRRGSRDVHEFGPPELPGGESLRVEDDGLALVLRQAGGKHTFHVEDSRTQETWFMPGPPFLIDGDVSAWDGSVRCDRIDRGFRVTASGFEKYPGLTLSYTLVLRNRALDVSLDPIQFPSEKNFLSLSFPLDFGVARAGEEGYLVNSYGNYDAREGRIFPFGPAIDRYRDSGELELGGESTMPFFGIVRRGHPCVAIVSDFPAVDFELKTSLGRRSPEGDSLYATTPIWRYERGRMNEPRHITYQFLAKGGYVEVAKAYRRFLVETGRYHTLRQRIERHPICSRAGNASFFWGAPVVGELPAFMAKLEESGVDKAVLHVANRNDFVGGWKRWPNGMTAAGGTAEEFRNAADFARQAGYGFSPVDEYTPFAVGGSDYDASLRATTREGGYHEFAKEQCFFLCESQKLRFAQRDLPGVKDVVGECPYLLDCEGCSVYECHDPRHPVTSREQVLARRELLTYVRETMGSVVSEGSPLDAFTDVVDVGHGHSIGFQWWESKPGVFVPLWSLVYAGAVVDLYRVSGAEDGMPYAALYGLNARFDDYKVGAMEVEWHKRISDAWPDRNCYELVGHEFVTPLVQKSRFRENDSVVDVIANFGDAEYLYGAHPIPPRDFRVFVGGVTVQE